jgi:threonyl-tRNA synthetase
VVLPVGDKFVDYAKKVAQNLNNSEIRASVDERNEKIGKKIRDSELQKIPYMLIVGEKEENSETVSVRKQGEGDLGTMSAQQFAEIIAAEIREKLGRLRNESLT